MIQTNKDVFQSFHNNNNEDNNELSSSSSNVLNSGDEKNNHSNISKNIMNETMSSKWARVVRTSNKL